MAQRGVAGEHGVEVAARFQPLPGAAGDGGLDQGGRVLGIALRLGEPAQVAGIVAAAQLSELAHDPTIEVVEPGAGLDQLLDQP